MKSLTRVLTVAAIFLATCGLANAQKAITIQIPQDQNVLEFVGQFNNTPTSSQQFGYLSNVQGLSPIFTGTPENEATASFAFVTNATADRVISDGPLKIINRTGTTTIYLNNGPSDFTNPASFSQGTSIQVSSYRQQVILNTLTNTFLTVHTNTVTDVETFTLNGVAYRLGQLGKSFRTNYSGQANTPGAVPSGWFAGTSTGSKN